jgi:predicted TIM-barrel fold metal-dependent hydrolase
MSAEPGKTETNPFAVNEEWLATYREPIIDPDLPIVDPHHHLWDNRGFRYLFADLLADTGSGHNIRATVFLQCRSMYRADADAALAPVGETEFVNGAAAMSASGLYGPTRLCAGIVGFADLTLGAGVERVLEAHLRAAGDRFKGIRNSSVWDEDPSVKTVPGEIPRGLLLDGKFREGFARLARHGLSFDAWHFHHQIPDLIDLARAFPDTVIVLNHIGGPIGIRAYAGKRADVFRIWADHIAALARCPNVYVKLGGMGMNVMGFGFDDYDRHKVPVSSETLAAAWRPSIEHCIGAFGVDRCMFESNFPVDKGTCSYAVLWNAFKRLAAGYSPAEKQALFSATARRAYRLPEGLSDLPKKENMESRAKR